MYFQHWRNVNVLVVGAVKMLSDSNMAGTMHRCTVTAIKWVLQNL